MSYSSNGLDLRFPYDLGPTMRQLERERNCKHETACWLPPDFSPDRYRCNDCGKQVATLEELRK
jgi:hypothetical protein